MYHNFLGFSAVPSPYILNPPNVASFSNSTPDLVSQGLGLQGAFFSGVKEAGGSSPDLISR